MKYILCIAVVLALCQGALAAPAPTKLSLTPSTDAVATQTFGSPSSPPSFSYRLTSNRGSINWRIGTKPAWLCPDRTSGKTAATVVLTVCGAQQVVGVFTAPVTFIASTNTITINAKLTVTAITPPPPPPPPPAVTSCKVQVGNCPLNPGAANQTIDDNYDGAGSNAARCMQRASDYSTWCATTNPVTATYYLNAVATNTVTVQPAGTPPPSGGYLLDLVGARLCTSDSCQEFLTE